MSDPIARLNAALESRYTIERELGEGGMATVYLAKDLKHNRNVALKVLKPELAAVVGAERFLAEIETTANLTHPHILPLHDSGEADSFLFYVMPHIQGEALRERIDREKQLGVDDAVAITQKVAGALDYAHQNGVVHRDIKPGNILLNAQGEPLVADFGIALAVAQAGAGRITETGLSLGTPHYMSPEQATGDRDVDPRSDVYALGCVLYEMLAGQPPFSASTAQAVLVKILTADAPSITSERRTVAPHVGHALAKALEKLPADRFTSAAEFAAALADEGFTYKARARTSVTASGPDLVATHAPAGMTGPWNRLTVAFATTAVLLGGLAAWDRLGPQPVLQPMRAVVDFGDRRLPAPSEIVVSPDGSRFAVAGVLAGQQARAIYWREGAEENFRLIPGTEGNTIRFMSFSPDSESLVYVDGDALLKVAISGGAPRPVVPSGALAPRDNHWGDDGTIVFTSNARGLYRVPDTGGEPEVLLESTPARNPRLLPGGQAVIFTNPDASSTYLLDLRTDSLSEMIPGGVDAMYVETGHLLYADQTGSLWAVEFNVGRAEVVGEAVPVLDGISIPRPYWARYSVSRNGTLVYEAGPVGGTLLGPGFNLLVVDLEGGEELLPLTPRNIERVEVSRDGRSVVYESTAAGDESPDIYTYDVELGTTPRPLTFEGINQAPVFSPGGNRVAFASSREGTDGLDLFVKTLDDDEPARAIITLAGDQLPTQWPSDTLIVFESGPPPSDLWMLNLSDPDNVVAAAYLEQQADLRDIKISPDGTLAAYGSNETGLSEIYIRSFPDPGLQTPVSQGGGQFPFWSPSGDIVHHWTLASIGSGDGDFFMAVHIQRNPTPVVLSRDSLFSGNYYRGASDLHPDGDRLLVAQAVSVRPTPAGEDVEPERSMVVINWFTELRQRVGN